MAYMQLMLPKNKKVQQLKLLEQLAQWDAEKLERSLTILTQNNAIVKLRTSYSERSRTISLKLLSLNERSEIISALNPWEQVLYTELEKWKPHKRRKNARV